MKFRLSIALVALMIAAVGCSDDGQSTPPMGGSGGSGGSGGMGGMAGEGGMGGMAGEGGMGGMAGEGGMGGVGGAPVSFATDILPYFSDPTGMGAVSPCTTCHSGGTGQGNVNLDSYANMEASDGPLWVAEDSSMGTLIPQLEADHNDGPDDDAFVPILSQWIDEGALDN